MDKAARQRLSRHIREQGRLWEKAMEGQFDLALQAQMLIGPVVHNQPSTANKRRGATWATIYTAATVADYTAMLPGGFTFALECKSTSGERFDLETIPPLQVKHLDAVSKNGGRAFLAMEFREEEADLTVLRRHQFLVPWRSVPWQRVVTHRAITRELLQAGDWQVRGDLWLRRHVTFCDTCGEVVTEVPWVSSDPGVEVRRTCRCTTYYGVRRSA